jgi:hypothetical protein
MTAARLIESMRQPAIGARMRHVSRPLSPFGKRLRLEDALNEANDARGGEYGRIACKNG